MLLGTIDTIRRYPVKGLSGDSLDATEIVVDGIPGDRAARLVVESGHARVGRAYRGMDNEELHLASGIDEAIEMARERGIALRSESGERYHDDGAISLIVDRWLDDLSAHIGYAVEPERFRPNFLAKAAPDFALRESELIGKTLEIGSTRLRVRKPISRCVTITYDPQGGPADARILRLVAQERDAIMGVYCDVLRTGTARRGDSVRLVER
jgi:hypothetical protein